MDPCASTEDILWRGAKRSLTSQRRSTTFLDCSDVPSRLTIALSAAKMCIFFQRSPKRREANLPWASSTYLMKPMFGPECFVTNRWILLGACESRRTAIRRKIVIRIDGPSLLSPSVLDLPELKGRVTHSLKMLQQHLFRGGLVKCLNTDRKVQDVPRHYDKANSIPNKIP